MLATTVIFAFNSWQHLPNIVPNHYSDVTSVFWREGIGRGQHLVPYVSYVFEYPAIVGIMVYLASSCRYFIPGYSSENLTQFSTNMVCYTLSMHLMLFPFILGSVWLTYRLCEGFGGDKQRIWKLFLLTPSFLMFSVYNWDMVAIFFTLLSALSFLRGRLNLSAISLGFGGSTKIYPLLLLPVLTLECKTWSERVRFVLITAVTGLAINLPFITLNFKSWFGTWTYLAGWGIENSWLIFFFKQLDQTAHYVALVVMAYLFYKAIMETSTKKYDSANRRIFERWLLADIAWLFGSYIVTPQMALMLLPVYTLIPSIPIHIAYLADALNALIIVLWFTPQLNLGNPLSPTSPVQIIAATRQLVWLWIYLGVLYPEKAKSFLASLMKRVGE